MLSAFQPKALYELKPRDKSRIESLLAYGDRLLVGLSTGSLRIFRVNETSHSFDEPGLATEDGDQAPASPSKAKAVDLLREEEKFSRKPVQQLAIVKEANLLVSLSDGYISLHDLQTFQLVERIERTKGAICFSVTSNVVKDAETGVPSLVSRMAVGVKRKLLCWTWRDMEMESNEPVELAMEATVKSLNWVHGGSGMVRLVVGMDPGFCIVDADAAGNGGPEGEGMKPVYKPASRQDTTSGELAGVRFAAVSSSGMGYMGMSSWVPKPMVTGLFENEILLAKDVNTLFTDIDGKALERRQVPWSLPPEAVGFSYPYMLALQVPEKGALQIRNPATLTLLQTIGLPSANILHVPQPNISLAHAGKGFLVASDRTIWRMDALPYDAQLAELVDRQRFDEAVSLLSLLEDTLIDDKLGRIREIKIQKAVSLFQQQKYRLALDLFTEAQAPPERVIALYPPSIAGELSSLLDLTTEASEPDNVTEDEAGKLHEQPAKEGPLPTTPSKGTMSKIKSGHARKDSDTASIKAAARADTDNMSIRPSKASPAKPAAPTDKPLEGEDLKFAVHCLCSFLAQARVQIQKYLSTDGTLKHDPPELDAETGKTAFANLLPSSLFTTNPDLHKIKWEAELLAAAKLVDTTLFRAYMLALPSLAGPLFRLDNFCSPDVVQASLYENERYGDLIDFLHGKKLHRQALEMLQKFGKGEAQHEDALPDGMKGAQRTVAYLKQLPPEMVDLVLEFVRWPLGVEKEKGMEVFVADTDFAERLPRGKVVEFLKDMDEGLEEEYLEHVVGELGDGTAEFHQRLVDVYIARLKVKGGQDEGQTKQKLDTFLRKSTTYNKVATFRQLPTADATFYEARAIVLSAMGNHKQALSIYVFQLKDYAKAEQYCNDIYLRQQQDGAKEEACLVDSHAAHPMYERSTSEYGQPSAVREKDNVFAMLLGLYLRPPPGEEKRWPEALDLLSRHGARLPASSTLDLMPDDLAVSELQDYFLGRIRNATSVMRESAVVKSLAAVQRSNTERAWLLGPDALSEVGKKAGRNRRVRISEEDHCKVCHKRFGASAVRVYPDDGVVHYGCVPGKRAVVEGAGESGRRVGGRAPGQRGWG
ncbi:Vacuolar morphogenesis protein 6 [Friedmanniomyces endolithicus]|nr:Vacuolar morphogenesis protein 6 [Friedmanniomyces endolithicus]KAK0813165.1 Vacuolar morphogenesis protein 6 [Friedmanniomyces endolithicus]KAK0814863.1 Vacuolar morphogenesis protein 6 [Friedmanniomyces endolithicus]KAK0820355.1 Vacuolar morphogenesis protein 6 [Friedmanniomyces endolithicus]KAK0861975.1 Vacuolar morphogenesis protein 6 [Friedmanniomyces endolithicus]